MNEEENCYDCKYCHILSKFIPSELRWEYGAVCIFHCITNNDEYDDYALVIDDPNTERCEVFDRRYKN